MYSGNELFLLICHTQNVKLCLFQLNKNNKLKNKKQKIIITNKNTLSKRDVVA